MTDPEIINPNRLSVSRIVLLFVLGLFLFATMYVSRYDRYPLNHYELTIINSIFAAKNLHSDNRQVLISDQYINYPPLFFIISSNIPSWQDKGRVAANKICWFWICLSISGMFLFMRGRFSRWQTLFGLAVLISSPFPSIASKYIVLDLGHMAVFFWFLWALDKSQSFDLTGWSVIAGLTAGAGFLIRWNFQILILLPCFLIFLKSLTHFSLKRALNILIFCLIQVVILSSYFNSSLNPPGREVFAEKMFSDLWSYWSILLYPHILFHSMVGPTISALIVLGIVVGIYKNWKTTLYLVITALAILIAATVFPTKNFRYIYVLPPLLAIFAAFLWSRSNSVWNLLLIAVLCAGNLGATTYPDGERLIHERINGSKYFIIRPIRFSDSNWDELRRLVWGACQDHCRIFFFDFNKSDSLEEYDYEITHGMIGHNLATPGISIDRDTFKSADQFSEKYQNIFIFPDSVVTPQLKSMGKSAWFEIENLTTTPHQIQVIILDKSNESADIDYYN